MAYSILSSNIQTFSCSPPGVKYVSKHSKEQIAVVENEEQPHKFFAIKSDLPDLKGTYENISLNN